MWWLSLRGSKFCVQFVSLYISIYSESGPGNFCLRIKCNSLCVYFIGKTYWTTLPRFLSNSTLNSSKIRYLSFDTTTVVRKNTLIVSFFRKVRLSFSTYYHTYPSQTLDPVELKEILHPTHLGNYPYLYSYPKPVYQVPEFLPESLNQEIGHPFPFETYPKIVRQLNYLLPPNPDDLLTPPLSDLQLSGQPCEPDWVRRPLSLVFGESSNLWSIEETETQ